MKLTLDALEVLDAIDKKGSFAAAAAVLFRVPSAVTYVVQKLEDDMGFVIFRREGRRSVLTPAGKVLLEQGRELLKAAECVVESAYQVNCGWESNINIAIDTVWDIAEFLPIIKQFYQLNTGVQVNLTEEVMGGSLDAIIENRADIVIGGPPPIVNMSGIKFEELAIITWVFVVSENHPLTEYKLPLSENDTKSFHSVIIKDSSIKSPIMAHRVFEKQAILKVATMEQKICALIQGLGVGFLPEHRAQRYINSGELVTLPLEKAVPKTTQYCSWKINNKGKATRWFINKILETKRLNRN